MKNYSSLNESKKFLLIKIRHGFGLNENVQDLLDSYFELDDDERSSLSICILQEALVEFVLENEVLARAKINLKYKCAFLKYVIAVVEKQQQQEEDIEVNEKIFQSYMQQINGESLGNAINCDEDKYHLVVFDKVIFYF